MRVLGLDLSSSTGYAIIEDGSLYDYGKIVLKSVSFDEPLPELNSVMIAQGLASEIKSIVLSDTFDLIVIEQTNLGSARGTQKGLEFIHFAVLDMLMKNGLKDRIAYVDTSAWRKALGIKLSKEQRKHNQENSKAKRLAKKSGATVKAVKKGEGKITWKHLSVAWANSKFGLELKLVDNDKADAIALAVYGFGKLKSVKQEEANISIKVFE